MTAASSDWTILGRAVGLPAGEVESRLGNPEARHAAGRDHWLVFPTPGGRLRVRCEGPSDQAAVVASWSLTFDLGFRTLREATEPFGLWPECAPDEMVGNVSRGLIRRAVSGASSDVNLTLTATVREDRIRKLDLFDEDPDWL